MIKLGLVGSHISHSLSPSIYKTLLITPHSYSLIDVQDESLLPKLSDLSQFYGLNITAPWKRSFFDQLVSFESDWNALNCLRNDKGRWVGTNTDALALQELIPETLNRYAIENWVILGDGAMAFVTKKILEKLNYPYVQFSRSKGDDFNQFQFLQKLSSSLNLCIINTCSRDVVINGYMSENWLFWDYNYQHSSHFELLSKKVRLYIDGSSLLYAQAKHAVKFWDLA